MQLLKYPIEVVFIDDDTGFTKDLKSRCSKYFPNIRTFNSASRFLNFIECNHKIREGADILKNADNYNEKELNFVIKINEILKLKSLKKTLKIRAITLSLSLFTRIY